MTPLTRRTNHSGNLTVVIRSAGERTFEICKAMVLMQIQSERVFVVNERPFEIALRKTYEIGIESNTDWLMTLDADVMLREGAVSKLLFEAENLPINYFQIEGLVHDKLTGMYRKAGHRIYRTRYLKAALQLIPEDNTEIRPEFTTLQRMESKGYLSKEIRSVFGIHDYEQFYRDIYRKAFVHANKHAMWVPKLISRWKNMAAKETDFRIALRGLYDGLLNLTGTKIDTREYIAVGEKAMNDLGIQEKSPLPCDDIDFKLIETVLSCAGKLPDNHYIKPLMTRRQRLKNQYTRLGIIKLAPYLFGALLCNIGAWIKRIVEKEI